jgi:hypothetical protein
MGVTRIAWLTGRGGGGTWLNCADMAANSLPRLRSRFSKSRDRTVMAVRPGSGIKGRRLLTSPP